MNRNLIHLDIASAIQTKWILIYWSNQNLLFFIGLLELVKREELIRHYQFFNISNFWGVLNDRFLLLKRILNFLYHSFQLIGPDSFLSGCNHHMSVKIEVFIHNVLFFWIKQCLSISSCQLPICRHINWRRSTVISS